MKNNLWIKNSVNNYEKNYKSAHQKSHLTSMSLSAIKKKPKRVRSAFTTEQVNYLEKEYKKYPYIGTGHRKEIANSLNISERTVKIWFQNRRMREKKETITKEFCDEQTGRQQVEFAKNRLNNVITMQSVNDQSLNSLPLLTSDVNNTIESTMNNKAFKDRDMSKDASKYFQKPNLQKSRPDPNLLTFLKNRTLPKDSSRFAQTSIDSCKKYVKLHNNLQTISNNTGAKKQSPSLMTHNLSNRKVSSEDLSKKTSVQSEQKTCAGYGHGISGFPVVPNFYPQPFVTPGGVLWKPVNVMSVMPRTCPTIPSNDFNVIGSPEQSSATKMCQCNCHTKSFPINMGFQSASASSQYVLTALPLQNPSTKF